MKITFRSDVFRGTKKHPQCPFFEEFPSGTDPNIRFDILVCSMIKQHDAAEICKGDYCKCPVEKWFDDNLKNNKINIKFNK